MVDGYLMHHGIKGQKWGVRRFQNEDGSYTTEGKERRKEETIKSKTKNYIKTVKSLSDDEFKLFTGDPNKNKKEDIKEMKRYIKAQPNHKDVMAFVSKNGNVTMAYLDNHPYWGKQWEIGWATNPNTRGTGVTQANIKETIKLIREQNDYPISAIIDPDNIASIKTAEKAGFVKNTNVYDPLNEKIKSKYVYK